MSSIEQIHAATEQAKEQTTQGWEMLQHAGQENQRPIAMALGSLMANLQTMIPVMADAHDRAKNLAGAVEGSGPHYEEGYGIYAEATEGTDNQHAIDATELLRQSAYVITGKESPANGEGRVPALGELVVKDIGTLLVQIQNLAAQTETTIAQMGHWFNGIGFVAGGETITGEYVKGTTEQSFDKMDAFLAEIEH